MRWDRISVLLDKIKDDIEVQGYAVCSVIRWQSLTAHRYFFLDSETDDVKLQGGAVRTNCLDNLDRTNVAQAAIAKYVLTKQLREVGTFGENETVDDYEELSAAFRESQYPLHSPPPPAQSLKFVRVVWADHADAISKAYSGTGALKTDFTRTGKRTKKGALDDLSKSAMRYLKNNFFDGARQDGFDLVMGTWTPEHGTAGFLISDDRPLILRAVSRSSILKRSPLWLTPFQVPYVFWFSAFMVAAGLTLPRSSGEQNGVFRIGCG